MNVQGDYSGTTKPPVDFQTKVPLWPDQARLGQAKADLKSTGGLVLPEWSPCIDSEAENCLQLKANLILSIHAKVPLKSIC